jgi:hypothetical protein
MYNFNGNFIDPADIVAVESFKTGGRVMGYWRQINKEDDIWYECSSCDGVIANCNWTDGECDIEWNYCPYCGERMDDATC